MGAAQLVERPSTPARDGGTYWRSSSQIGQRSGGASDGVNCAPQVAQWKKVTVGDDVAMTDVLRYAAFTDDPEGGNPAGVVLDAAALTDAEMLAIAAELGYSETAFLDGADIRYFSPLAEVPFCGHATIATAVALADRDGPGEIVFSTARARSRSTTRRDGDGRITATLTSVPPKVVDLDPRRPRRGARGAGLGPRRPRSGAAAARRLCGRLAPGDRRGHPRAARRPRLRLRPPRRADGRPRWTTVQLVWREHDTHFHARDPFPPGGVVEDPATGAAAAALGGYLRDARPGELPATITIVQGDDIGRPSLLTVDITERPEIDVTGTAVVI